MSEYTQENIKKIVFEKFFLLRVFQKYRGLFLCQVPPPLPPYLSAPPSMYPFLTPFYLMISTIEQLPKPRRKKEHIFIRDI